jgi:hypothetical protein
VVGSSGPALLKSSAHRALVPVSFGRCREARKTARLPARAESRVSKSEQYREESEWRSELEPKQPLARPPDGLNVVSALSSVDFDLDSSDTSGRVRRDWGLLNAVADRWDELPARWKMITATSLAFVICNMVMLLNPWLAECSRLSLSCIRSPSIPLSPLPSLPSCDVHIFWEADACSLRS